MPDSSTLAVFVIAALVLLVTPGPAVLYIVARSIDQGRWAGLVSTLGIAGGSLFHVAAAALGVSALLMSSALAFNAVKYLGAAYLIYLGARRLLTAEEIFPPELAEQRQLSKIFYQGVVVNLLNPKTALFFLAFLPQFVDVNRGGVVGQILFLGALFVILGVCSDGLYALLAGTMGHWLRGSLHFLKAQRYVAGSVFIFLGLTAAFSGSGKK